MKLLSPSPKAEASLAKLQILIHQCKIPRKIEVILASNENEDNIGGGRHKISSENTKAPISFGKCSNIRRLGYVSIDSNEKTNFEAREMKSINIPYENVSFVKLVIHSCHENRFNPHNQVGIIAINMLGKIEGEQTCIESTVQKKGIRYRYPSSDQNNPVYEVEENDLLSKKETGSSSDSMRIPGLDPNIQERLDKLREEKDKMVWAEDFDNASRLKDVLTNVNKLFSDFTELGENMKLAALEENYPEASRLKQERDHKRVSAMKSLEHAEKIVFEDEFASGSDKNNMISDTLSTKSFNGLMDPDERPITTTPRDIEFDSEMRSQGQKSGNSNKNINNKNALGNVTDEVESHYSRFSEHSDDESSQGDEEENHPLKDVVGYEELPDPEEINAFKAEIPKDTFDNIENMLGEYRARCFFSKNWLLREAVIVQTIKMLPDIIQTKGGLSNCSITLSQMLERGINDRIVQVVLTTFILLDNCLSLCEIMQYPHKEATQLVGKKILSGMISKLGDSKRSVVEAAETILLSMAFSKCIGVTYIFNFAVKPMKPRDIKSGRVVTSRLHFLQILFEEFDEELTGGSSQTIEFIKGKRFSFVIFRE